MTSILPIGIEELLSGAAEGARLEVKASWDEVTTGFQVLKTLAAFANDLQNLNGGYVVLGAQEKHGVVERPVVGLDPTSLEAAEKWIRGNCQRIEPAYVPVFETASIDGQWVLVLWAPASDIRPHQAPDGRKGERRFWVRLGSETVEAKDELLTRLMQQTARVPFDDRRAFDAQVADLRITLVRELLRDVKSGLLDEPDGERVYAAMHLTRKQNGHQVPRNVALLFFSDDPERWFRGARIEVAQFADEAGGSTIEEQRFTGPIQHQIRQCLSFLENLTTHHLEKQPANAEARGWVSYPSPALREAVVNAVYHRGYEDVVEPTKVYLYPNRVEVISYPGPVDGIERQHLEPGASVPPVPARNRRIGELLKDLRLAEARGTGLPKMLRAMRDNGSPDPSFDFDEARSYFRVTLPAHPEYVALSALRDAAYFEAVGDKAAALRRLSAAHAALPGSALVAARLIEELAEQAELERARVVAEPFLSGPEAPAAVVLALARAYVDGRRQADARAVLARLPAALSPAEAIDAGIVARRMGEERKAHECFLKAGEALRTSSRGMHELAQSKLLLAEELRAGGLAMPGQPEAHQKLLEEAEELLARVVAMEAPAARRAWAWLHLARTRATLGKPESEVGAALQKVAELAAGDALLEHELALLRARSVR